MLKDKLIQAYEQSSKNGILSKKMRDESFGRFVNKNFPTVKDEEWKYTNLLPIIKKDYDTSIEASTITEEQVNDYILTATDTYLMVFVNGVLSENLSNLPTGKVVVSTIEKAIQNHPSIVSKYLNSCVPEKADAFVSINNALANNGVFLYAPKNAVLEKPLQIVFATNNVGSDLFLQTRSLIIAEENAQIQVTERHQNFDGKEVFTNAVTEINAADNSIVDFYKIQNDNRSCSLVDNTWVRQGKNTNCTVDTFSLGGKFIRNNLTFFMEGEHSESNMNGITLIGKDQLVDHHTSVDHLAPNCQSNELYKGIYDDNSKGIFNGKVMVRPDSQKTNAFQSNNNLLLTDNASIDTKPQLEIYADDVACSHGCTIGQLDDEALFYLRSRGIPVKEAKAMLMYAFASDAIQNIKIAELEEKLNRIIAEKLVVELTIES